MIKKFTFNLTEIAKHYNISVQDLSTPTLKTQSVVGDLLYKVIDSEDFFEDTTNLYTVMDIFTEENEAVLYVTDNEPEINLVHKKIFKTDDKPHMTRIEENTPKIPQPASEHKALSSVVSLLKAIGLSDIDIDKCLKDSKVLRDAKTQEKQTKVITENVYFLFDDLESALTFIDEFAGFSDKIHLEQLYKLHHMYFVTGSISGTENNVKSLAAYLSDYCVICAPMSLEHGEQIMENINDTMLQKER